MENIIEYNSGVWLVFLILPLVSFVLSKETDNGKNFVMNFIEYYGLMVMVYIIVSYFFYLNDEKFQEKKENIRYNVTLVLENSKDTINVGSVREYDTFLLILKDSSKISKSKIIWMKSKKTLKNRK